MLKSFEVFQCFSVRRLTLNKDKCKFNQDKLTFLGFVLLSEGISPDPMKVDTIHNAPIFPILANFAAFLDHAKTADVSKMMAILG